MRALVDSFGVIGAIAVIVGAVWAIGRARGLRRHRIDLHIYVHPPGDDQDNGDD